MRCERLRGEAGRLHGLDLARAVAITGMVINHLGQGLATYELDNGYPSALFAVLAGVSLGIMMTKSGQAQLSVMIRGSILFFLGIVLNSIQSTIAVVLFAIAFIYFFLPPLARARTRTLVLVTLILGLAGAVTMGIVDYFTLHSEYVEGPYPFFTWLFYGSVGLCLWRFARVQWWKLAACSVPLTVAGTVLLRHPDSPGMHWLMNNVLNKAYEVDKTAGAGDVVSSSFSSTDFYTPNSWLSALFSTISPIAHSGGLGDALLSAVCSVAVISVCMLLCTISWMRVLTFPARMMGAMSLSTYTLHVATAQWLISATAAAGSEPEIFEAPSKDASKWSTFQDLVARAHNWEEYYKHYDAFYGGIDSSVSAVLSTNYAAVTITLLGLVLFATFWRLVFRKGPLEALLAWIIPKLLPA